MQKMRLAELYSDEEVVEEVDHASKVVSVVELYPLFLVVQVKDGCFY